MPNSGLTSGLCYDVAMEVHFPPDVESRIHRAAAENSCGAETYVEQLMEHCLEYDSWFRQKVKSGLASLDRDESLSHEEVGERIARLLGS